jgi:hypothetical protein
VARPTSHLLDRRSCSRRRSCPTLPRCRSCRSATPATVAHPALPAPQRLQLVLTTQDAIPLTATPVNVQGIQSANGMRMRANTSRRRRAGARDTHGGRSTPGRWEEKVFETRQKCLQKLAVLIVFLGTQTARKKSYKCQSRRPRHRNVRLRAQVRPVYRYLSIVRATQHHPLVGQPLVCRSGAVVSLHCSTIARCRERAAYKILFGRWRVTSCVGQHCYHQVV